MLFSDTIFLFFYFGFVKDSNVKQKNQQKQKSQWHKRISQIEIHCFAKQVIYATAQFMFISYSNYFTSICIFFFGVRKMYPCIWTDFSFTTVYLSFFFRRKT